MQEITNSEYQNRMIEAFIDKPSETLWYQMSFSKFNTNGVDTMKWNWSWWAFGGGFLYLLYRKQYLASLILFIASTTLGMIPFVSLLFMILAGGYSSFFVYKGYKIKLNEVEANIEDEDTRVETMRAVGGYHQWVVWVYSIFMLLIFSLGFMIIAPLLTQI